MIGLAFRQMRGTLIGTAALTAVLVAILVVHGLLARAVSSDLLQACATRQTATCQSLQEELWNMFMTIAPYLGYLTITTVLIAAFWGAPLVSREVETGTAALAWCQSVTRQQWFASRLTVSAAAVVSLGLALGFAVTWWLDSFTATPQGEDALSAVGFHGPLLPATWLTGLLVGVLIGTLIPRVIAAMAVTAVITFIGAIALNLSGSVFGGSPVGELQVLAHQGLQSLPVLIVGAGVTLFAFRQIKLVRI